MVTVKSPPRLSLKLIPLMNEVPPTNMTMHDIDRDSVIHSHLFGGLATALFRHTILYNSIVYNNSDFRTAPLRYQFMPRINSITVLNRTM